MIHGSKDPVSNFLVAKSILCTVGAMLSCLIDDFHVFNFCLNIGNFVAWSVKYTFIPERRFNE